MGTKIDTIKRLNNETDESLNKLYSFVTGWKRELTPQH